MAVGRGLSPHTGASSQSVLMVGGQPPPPADDQTERFRWKPLPLLEPNCTRDVLSLPPCSVGHRDSH